MYMSDVNQQGKNVKVAASDMLVVNQQDKGIKVAVCISILMSIIKEKVLKLRLVYIRCQSTKKKG